MNKSTKNIVTCALFAAITAVLSQIAIPIGPVPINMAHIGVFMGAGLLGAKLGGISQTVFVLMGAVGLPVFSGFSGGLSRVVGPTGGYIIAYIFSAIIAGIILDKLGRKSGFSIFFALYMGWIVTYIFGTLWYSYVLAVDFMAALSVCVVPFLLGVFLQPILCRFLI